jgi:hypothetical protein
MKRIAAVLALVILAGCSGIGVQSPIVVAPGTDPTPPNAQGLAAFTVADLQAASADAKAQVPPDITAAQCYDFLAQVVPTIAGPASGQTVGAFVAFQHARDLANGATAINGTLKSLNLACAPLVIDTQTTINKLIILGAGIGATGGALAPVIGALPTILP